MYSKLFALLLIFLLPDLAQAQNQNYKVITTDGTVLIGELISEDEISVTIRTDTLGEVTIARENIRSMERIEEDRYIDGRYWHPSAQPTRYFFAPNAYSIKKGTGYYQNTILIFNNYHHGISDRFSLGGGIAPFFLFGADSSPVWLMPKYSFKSERENTVKFAVGAMIGGFIPPGGANSGRSASILYGMVTIGEQDKNISIGTGLGFQGRNFSSRPVLNLNMIHRISPRSYLVSENYIFWYKETVYNGFTETGNRYRGTGLISAGYRFAPENFAYDFFLVRPLENAGPLLAIPMIGVNIPTGR